MKRIFSMLLCLLCVASLLGCNTSAQSEKEELSPIEKLTEKEKEFYDALLIGLESIYNPSKIRMLSIGEPNTEALPGFVYFKLQGTNKAGGTIVQTGSLVISESEMMKNLGFKIGGMTLDDELGSEDSYEVTWDDSSVGKINKALQYHWEELGIE